ncbi:MAG TPA: RidA family protein [Candidatus Dormibacteraeota bacterium]
MGIDERLAVLGIELPPVTTPVANYVLTRRSGSLLFVSGHVCKENGQVVTGRLGDSLSTARGQELARATLIDVLATVRDAVGSLDSVRTVIKLSAYVNSAETFTEQSLVANGASDLLVDVFGEERGRHARAAVGVAQLPLGAAVELEAIFEVA